MTEVINDNLFHLYTPKTSYLFTVSDNGELLHLYYGAKADTLGNARNALMQKWSNQNGCSVVNDKAHNNLCPDDEKYEAATLGKGDMRTPFVEIKWADGGIATEFLFEKAEAVSIAEIAKKYKEAHLPHSYADENGENNALVVTLKEKTENVRLKLYYCVYEDSDVITRSAEIINDSDKEFYLNSLNSTGIELDADIVKVTSFHGDWGREMEKCDVMLTGGKFTSESRTGNSSNHSNPFVMYAEPGATETSGEVYSTNLVYSGNHRESAEFGGHAKLRILSGINSDFFCKKMKPGESFLSPEGVMAYSSAGYRGISEANHKFVREHIVRGAYKYAERPVLLNSWEAAYFDISEMRLLKLAKAAKDVGIELFVVDDGWFGKRNSDKVSLGDWCDNKDKLPGGIGGLSKKVKALGLKFGLWVEPEMVNEDSDLYRAHPDWVIKNPARDHALQRNQMLLDFSKKEVREHIIAAMSDVFARSACDYVKWDMNRNFSDYFSIGGDFDAEGTISHDYIVGLYAVMEELTERFPNILFEGCASGGNRFDLGILSYFPQIWASDNTDAVSRASIQNGYSYGYPQSTWSCHVSASPNHQTLRVTPLYTRFAVALSGVFGYELNLCDLPKEELTEIGEQVAFYKKWRKTLQFGTYLRLGGTVSENSFEKYSGGFLSSRLDTMLTRFMIVSEDKSNALGVIVNGEVHPNYSHTVFKGAGLKGDTLYHFCNRVKKHDIRRMGDLINTMAPFHIKANGLVHNIISKFIKLDGETEEYVVSGQIINNAGINLSQTYVGTGYGSNTRLFADFESRVYEMTEVEETEQTE